MDGHCSKINILATKSHHTVYLNKILCQQNWHKLDGFDLKAYLIHDML